MDKNIKCPDCGSGEISKMGLSYGIGSGQKISASNNEQYRCNKCNKLFYYSGCLKGEDV